MNSAIRQGQAVVLALWFVGVAAGAQAQSAGGGTTQDSDTGTKPTWSFRASATTYFFPEDDNYVQPTVAADRGALHIEGRYNYENLHSVSGFVGWNVEFGETVTLQLTPMVGGVAGDTDGIIPALELDLAWRRLELYLEGEYVIDVDNRNNRFLYNWSEASVWVTEWLRAGLATQLTRVYRTPRDVQRGLLVGVIVSKVEAGVYLFNPGSDDYFIATSINVTF